MKSMLLHITNTHDKNVLKSIYPIIKEDSFIEINFIFDSITTTKFNDILYELSSKIITFKIDDIIYETVKYELFQNEIIANLLDERINSSIQANISNYIDMQDRIDMFNWRELQPLIDSTPNLESLFFKIQNNIIKIPEYAKNAVLFKIISTKSKFNDIDIVEHFLENNFDIKFAELILIYPNLNKKFVDRFISDPKINPIILQDYLDNNRPIPELDFFTEKTDVTDLEKFFDLIVKKEDLNTSEYILKFLNLKQTPAHILMSIHSLYDIEFIHEQLLSHPNCPQIILIKYSKFPAFGLSIAKNPELSDDILSFLLKNNSGSFQQEKIYNVILDNPNISNSIKREINNTINLKNNIVNQSNMYSLLSSIPISNELRSSLISKYSITENIHIFNKNKLLLSDAIETTNRLIEKFKFIENHIKGTENNKTITQATNDLTVTIKELNKQKSSFNDKLNQDQDYLIQQITSQLINTTEFDDNTIAEIKSDLNQIYHALVNDFNQKIVLQANTITDDIALTIVQKQLDSTVTKSITNAIQSNILAFKSNLTETINYLKDNNPKEFEIIKEASTFEAKSQIAELIRIKDFKKLSEIQSNNYKLHSGLIDLSTDRNIIESIDELITDATKTIKHII